MSLSPQKVDFEAVWATLSDGVRKVITLAGVKGMPMYEDIYRLCTAHPHPYPEELYTRLKQFLQEHVEGICHALQQTQGDLLSNYLREWTAYSVGSEFNHHIFRYLNGYWIRKRLEEARTKVGSVYGTVQAAEIYEVFTLSLVVWRDRLFIKLKDRIIRAILELATKDRDGEQINYSEVNGVMNSFVKLGSINKAKPLDIYKTDFEAPFLNDTREYYARESSAYIAQHGVSLYMKKAEERLEEEVTRGRKMLDPSSQEKMRKECESVLIARHKEMIQAECEGYLRDNKLEDLSRMYRLLSRIEDGVKPMLEVLENYIVAAGFDAIKAIPAKDSKDPKVYVEVLLKVYNEFCDIVQRAFSNDSQFVASLDKACRKIINQNQVNKTSSKSPELLAKYCDLLLKKGNKTVEEDDLDDRLGQVITIFKYVDDKDVFQQFYSKMLARRLIHGTSLSDDAESGMIARLKQACGFEYTSKLQRMFLDISVSGDINEKFKEWTAAKTEGLGKMDFYVMVLTAGSWPMNSTTSPFSVPQELEKCVNYFQTYYQSVHQGRKLAWLHHLAKGDLKTLCFKKRYEFQVTNYQMSVLLQYNAIDGDTLTFESLAGSTSLKESDLRLNLDSLVESKVLIPSATTGENGTYPPATSFKINMDFANKRLKLKLATPMQRETKQDRENTMEDLEEDRRLYLQAAIVRIMKARKTLNHNNLVQEVITQARARFQPNIQAIKRAVEHLIEKEYLERVEGESDRYNYVA